MPVPKGIVTELRDIGATSYVAGADNLFVGIDFGTSVFMILRIVSTIYEFDPTQSCEYLGQEEGGFYHFVFKSLKNEVSE